MKAEKNEPSIDKSLTLEQFQETVLQEQLTPLWMGAVGQLREPHTHIEPFLWHTVARFDSAWRRGGGAARADPEESRGSGPKNGNDAYVDCGDPDHRRH